MAERPPTVASLLGLKADEEQIRQQLYAVMDPELGVNIMDLGLVYGVSVRDGLATIRMTTTTPACPIGSYLTDQIRWALLDVEGLLDVEIEVTYEPLWSPERMSDAAKIQLGWLR